MESAGPGGAGQDNTRKPATAARIYDYVLGGIHNFPADQEAGRKVIEQVPYVRVAARANRAFLARSVRYLVRAGIRQFLDIGSGIPTEGNVHEVAQDAAPDARVVYVDIDPVAVAEGLDLLERNDLATSVRGDMRQPRAVLDHPQLRKVLDLNQPTALLLTAVLHFVPDDTEANDLVRTLVDAVPAGSYLSVAHGATESFADDRSETLDSVQGIYRRNTASNLVTRTREQVGSFFTGLDLVDPGLVWVPRWRPDERYPDAPDITVDPVRSYLWAAVGRKPA